jgi:hypothetical protein
MNIETSDQRKKEKKVNRVLRIEFIGNHEETMDSVIDSIMSHMKIILEQRSYPKEIKKIEVTIY